MPWPITQGAWRRDEIERLRTLRAQGLSGRAISRLIGRSERAVSSKAKDLMLPSTYKAVPPHERARGEDRPMIERAGKVTLPPLPSLQHPIDC